MTTTLKYVGKPTSLVGKTLWEILGNLKDFGVGRIIVRNSQTTRYKEPCFMRVLEVKAQPNEVPPKFKIFRPPNDLRDKDRPRQVYALCEVVFRGVKMETLQLLQGESSVPDFQLIPKHLEKNYKFTKTEAQRKEENILPRYLEFPPFLKDILVKNGVKEPKLKTVDNPAIKSLYRVAKEGEEPTRKFESGFDATKCPKLYEGINYDI
ncbi:28S ribosomal protein S34, mitochondrial [Sitodiplosis mosellana]|uniref:28S ribosomal protein S34, mitochondrial n=1 Tax=Sitodiplosis mosellana TaxID=263140 RepID=UPI002443CE2E|nr:28S ribosomal protein S34, mitochondrial [Sitodiplosis mosellana]